MNTEYSSFFPTKYYLLMIITTIPPSNLKPKICMKHSNLLLIKLCVIKPLTKQKFYNGVEGEKD